MILDFNNILNEASEVNIKHVTAVNVLCGRRYRTLFLDDRCKVFQETKPFAYSDGFYYVCCPCCHQIEKVAEHYLQDANIAKIQCSNRTISQKVMFSQGSKGIETTAFKTLGYKLNLEDWKA